jgi:hypothetical protein
LTLKLAELEFFFSSFVEKQCAELGNRINGFFLISNRLALFWPPLSPLTSLNLMCVILKQHNTVHNDRIFSPIQV